MSNFTAGPIPRADLPVEGRFLADGSGDYVSPWIDTSGATEGRVSVYVHGGTVPTVTVEEGQWDTANADPDVLRTTSVGLSSYRGQASIPLATRYFRVVMDGGDSNVVIDLSVRVV